MRIGREQTTSTRAPRRLNVTRIKLIIVALGAGLAALISSLTGITPQVALAPMIGWMLGFPASKSQATAMRATAGAAIACVAGALWRSSIKAIISPGTATRISQIDVASAVPAAFAMVVIALFVGATVGAIAAAKAAPRADMVPLRRIFLFVGVCIGMYMASEGYHYSTLAAASAPLVHGAAGLLIVGLVSGALTQVLGLASGVILVPSLYYFAGLSFQQSILVSLTVIGLAALLPAWSYKRRGLGDSQYGSAALMGGVLVGFVAGTLMVNMPTKQLLILFALMTMFFSAREISVLAAQPAGTLEPSAPSGPDLT